MRWKAIVEMTFETKRTEASGVGLRHWDYATSTLAAVAISIEAAQRQGPHSGIPQPVRMDVVSLALDDAALDPASQL